MRTLWHRLLAVTLVVSVTLAAIFIAWPRLGGPEWVADCGRFCYLSQVYDDNDNSTYTVEFAGADFTFLYWQYTGLQVWNGTTVILTDQPDRAHFNIEISGWTAYDVVIDVGGYVPIHDFAPLKTARVQHDGKLVGVATANTQSLWDRWVFLVSF